MNHFDYNLDKSLEATKIKLGLQKPEFKIEAFAKDLNLATEKCFGKRAIVLGKYDREEHGFFADQFAFYLNSCEAFSYGWWQFVALVDDTIYFNDAYYSKQTSVHQDMAMNILKLEDAEGHGYKIKKVYYKEGLNHLDRAVGNLEYRIKELKELIANPRSVKKVNARRLKEIQSIEKQIKEVKAFDKLLKRKKTKYFDGLKVSNW